MLKQAAQQKQMYFVYNDGHETNGMNRCLRNMIFFFFLHIKNRHDISVDHGIPGKLGGKMCLTLFSCEQLYTALCVVGPWKGTFSCRFDSCLQRLSLCLLCIQRNEVAETLSVC